MSKVVDHLAELTGFRDRDLLDATLVSALRDLLHPRCVGIHRLVGDDDDRRWLTRARLSAGEASPSADPIWLPFEQLPAKDAFPHRLQAMHQNAGVLLLDGPPQRVLYPVGNDHEVLGVLELEVDRALAEAEHQMVGGILRIYRNVQSLLDYSERDTLTGLLNRKTFEESFYKLHSRQAVSVAYDADDRRLAVPQPGQHFIGVLDIDHFKVVNDTYGHLIGDEVLLLMSRLMRSCFRFHDQLYRFGGEEFVVLLQCQNEADAEAALERFRLQVERHAFPQVGRITVSVGLAQVLAGDTPSAAFERADKAVYWAKTHGRNLVISHAALVATGALGAGNIVGDVELF